MSKEEIKDINQEENKIEDPLEYAMSLVKHQGVDYSDWQIKALGLQLVLLSLSETQAERIRYLSSAILDIEKHIYSDVDRVKDLESKDLITLYKMISDNLNKSKECVEDVLDSVNWTKLQNDLRSLSTKKESVDQDVAKAAKEILKSMAELYPISRKLRENRDEKKEGVKN